MTLRTYERRRRPTAAQNKAAALQAFMHHKAVIEANLARLQALAADHFHADPDRVTWADAGTLEEYSRILSHLTDMAFKEGEHAD